MEAEKLHLKRDLHLVMLPFFAYGHITPFVQLSNKLSSHGVRVSFLSAQGNLPRTRSMLNSNPTTQIIPLVVPPVQGLPPGIENTSELSPAQSQLLVHALDLMQPQIKELLSQLKPDYVVFDFAHEWLPRMASELGIKSVYYSVFVALSTAFLIAVTGPNNRVPSLEEVKTPIPGFPITSINPIKTFEARDFLYLFHGVPSTYDRVITGLKGCSLILAKTCNEMEAPYVQYLRSQFNKPVLLSGPGVPESRADQLDEKWACWLDQFEPKSVIYCSFGSETFLSHDEIRELALGLELTGAPFLLVLNFPTSNEPTTLDSHELQRALPEGFAERVRARGAISSGWMQQQQILAHPSVGCYLCHAGFSSIVEAIVNDCQLVMLPLKADQFMNSRLVSGDLRAGVEVNRRDEDGYFGKEDIKGAVEVVMFEVDKEPGISIRGNHEKWKDFLLDKGVQDGFIQSLVEEMDAIAKLDST